jgi:hypothetical protein
MFFAYMMAVSIDITGLLIMILLLPLRPRMPLVLEMAPISLRKNVGFTATSI